MDEWTLNDLLECSVCLERLDTSSKVLPCQHTFCRKCLEEIVSTHKELRCPECRILVDAQIDELPPNVLLMRILEGMKNSGNPAPKKKSGLMFMKQQPQLQQGGQQQIVAPQGPPANSPFNNAETCKIQPAQKQNTQTTQPFARALYDYISKEPGDLSFRKGELILLHRKVDAKWCQGECGGKTGIFPLSYVQVVVPLQNQIATCRALYDFKMLNDEDEGCLSFRKDEIITVIRRVDENWAEGKLNNSIGIFPLAFVEMNNIAQALMKLSINGQPGPSRIAPPTPNAEESTPLIPIDHSGVVQNRVSLHVSPPNPSQQTPGQKVPVTTVVSGDSGSTLSSSTSAPSSSSITPNSSSATSSNSNSAPNSPPSGQANPFLPGPGSSAAATTAQQPPQQQQQPPPPQGANGLPFGQPEPGVDTHCLWAPTQQPGDSVLGLAASHPKEKRHSFSAFLPSSQQCTNSNKHPGKVPTVSDSATCEYLPTQQRTDRAETQRHKRSGSDLTSGVCLPACCIALYPYKPQKADELELKKDGLYVATERCQDGWFKGTSFRTNKSGVFPGNYVTLVKQLPTGQGVRCKDLVRSALMSASSSSSSTSASSSLPKASHQQKATKLSQYGRQLVPPELPPRAAVPVARPRRSSFQTSPSWQHVAPNEPTGCWIPGTQKNDSEDAVNSEGRSSTSTPSAGASAPTPSKPAEKVKEKKEKSGLIRRFTTRKRSKSPPAAASYSMDNPVFDDAPAAPGPVQISAQHPVHLSQFMEGSTLAKIVVRPGASSGSGGSSHRKSNSLDGDVAARKPRQLVPSVRERFRCIVPYPPNSEYELELKVGDIIYVHKKREDGWYKGTQQRTGRTGLFPASFVEIY